MAKPKPSAIDPADAAVLELLPSSLADIARVIGVAATLKLCEARPGGRIFIPKEATPDHWIAELLGIDAFAALVHVYKGERPEIPLAHKWQLRIKERAIVSARRAGQSQYEVAQQYGMTQRGIRKAERRAESRTDTDQLDLF